MQIKFIEYSKEAFQLQIELTCCSVGWSIVVFLLLEN